MKESPLSRNTIAKFRQGICHLLAFELQRKHDWPLYGIIWEGVGSVWHLLNQTETGVYIDALGAYSEKDVVLSLYPPVGQHPNVFVIESVEKSDITLEEPLFENEKAEAQRVAERLSNWFYNKVLEK